MKRFIRYPLILGACLASGVAIAGGPMVHLSSDGTPYTWPQGKSIVWNPDLGNLGDLNNAEAVATIEEAFKVWTSVESADLVAQRGEPLAVNVTAENVGEHLYRCDGKSPVIFDEDGSLMDSLLGEGAGCALLGFAGPECVGSKQADIIEGMVVISGRALDADGPCPVPPDVLKRTLVHELGHFLNLGHTQVNGNAVLFQQPIPGYPELGVPGLEAVAMMYPLLFIGERSADLTTDDIYWLSQLYPADPSVGGTLRGDVMSGDNPLQGVNLVLRDPLDPLHGAVSVVSGHKMVGDIPNPSLQGSFEFPGLWSGVFSLEAGEVNESFTGGSSLPPLSTPLDVIPGRAEFLEFFGGPEHSDPAIDDPGFLDFIEIDEGADGTPLTLALNQPLYCEVDSDCSDESWCDGNRCVPDGVFDPGTGDGADDTPVAEESPDEATPSLGTDTPSDPSTPTSVPPEETEAPTEPGETGSDTPSEPATEVPPSDSPSPEDDGVPDSCTSARTGAGGASASMMLLLVLVARRGTGRP